MALEKPATQVGTFPSTHYVFTADRAVDGNTDPDVYRNSCAFFESWTLNIPCWWYVELGDVYQITQVILYNRRHVIAAGKISI